MKKFAFLITVFFFTQNIILTQPCLPDGISFYSQNDIYSFYFDYPNCTEIGGTVLIYGEDISSLGGLSQINTIGGNLFLAETSVTSFSGLENLSSIDSLLGIINNHQIEDFAEFSELDSVGGIYIGNNWSLKSFSGLELVTSLSGVTIHGNASLQDFSGLNNLSVINGNFIIENNSTLSDFSGLDSLQSILGLFKIEDNSSLIDFKGLDNLKKLNGSSVIKNNPALVGLSGLDSLSSISGELIISENASLLNLTGLQNLDTVNGDLSILTNNALVSLDGLDNLNAVFGTLAISKHPKLQNINSLSNLSVVSEHLLMEKNNSLKSLEGLENIEGNSIKNLHISENDSLEKCDVESICEYLQAPHGVVTIYSNALGCNNPSQIADSCGFTLDCLPFGAYHLNSQTEIDNFKADYSGCHDLKGSLYITGEGIDNLDSLNEIISLTGGLSIGYTDILTNLVGLSSLNSVGDGLSFERNELLESLHGIENLKKLNGGVYLLVNPSLLSLDGLEGIDSLNGSLQIRYNAILSDLTALESLVSLNGELNIWGNHSLKSLIGLENIDEFSIHRLEIFLNDSLSYCEVESICNYVTIHINPIFIDQNYWRCNSINQVIDACETVGFSETTENINVLVYPNPFTTATTMQYQLEKAGFVSISIFNHLGKKVDVIQNHQSAGNNEVVWNAGSLPDGMYYFTIQANDKLFSGKMVLIN